MAGDALEAKISDSLLDLFSMPPNNVYYSRSWEEVRISFYFMNVNCKCAIFYGQGFTNDYW